MSNNYRTKAQGQSIKISQRGEQKHENHKGIRTTTVEIFESQPQGNKNNNSGNLRIAVPELLGESHGADSGGERAQLQTENERKGKVNGLTGRLEGAAQKNLKL